ncbi:MAG: SMC family ATPase [Actinomycetota bacterium]|nr:SMC family ATPase [Actinomycetota bacterium]
MRPLRLELEGFTSFRDPTVIDLEDADYFVLVGPTGSGKSTVIDAMCFALYGSVPRYDDRRLVAPVITQGQLQAKVRFDFSVGDVTYTAVRVVRRQGKGATTKEARLERDGEVLAGNADELTSAIVELLGLTFEHFTKCVVLPQGEFARFLHDKPSERQGMLVELLGLSIYERMGQTARARAAFTKSKIELNQRRLEEDFSFATTGALREAKARAKRLRALKKQVDEAAPELTAIERALEEHAKAIAEVSSALAATAKITLPETVSKLADEVAHSRKLIAEADAGVAHARSVLGAADEHLEKLPDPAPLRDAVAAHAQRAELQQRAREAGEELERATARRAEAAGALKDADKVLATARSELDAAIEEHQAQHLAGSLAVGEPCPVCLQPVAELPAHPQAPGLETARAAVADAEAKLPVARSQAETVSTEVAVAGTRSAALQEQMAGLDKKLEAFPARDDLETQLAAIEHAQRAAKEARAALDGAFERAAGATRSLERLKEQEEVARREFDAQRDGVAALEPPPRKGKDLSEEWAALARWAAVTTGELEERLSEEQRSVRESEQRRAGFISALQQSCSECELEVRGGDVAGATVAALTSATSDVTRIGAGIAAAEALRTELVADQTRFSVANGLAHHLSAKGFEKWMVNEALARLVRGASEILRELSGAQYSLSIDDDGSFLVTDHHNADEVRSAKTLSGGETFLASLSLALALADHLIDLAAEGAARLEAIFLDEGFGTLDPETLDTVAATIENLAARGRMVGIITHVRELADRVPLQFRVKKAGRSSTIERVYAGDAG